MAVNLATKFLPFVDEMFTKESKKSLLTNNDFNFDGSGAVKIYKISTSEMNDYGRNGATGNNWSRYGAVQSLDATTEEMQLKRDRSFTFAIDKLDTNETVGQLEGASALARQVREVVIPEIDTYVYKQMAENAGTKVTIAKEEFDVAHMYNEVVKASQVLDEALVPDEDRVLLVTPDTYRMMKVCEEIIMNTDIGAEDRKKGVIGILDGAVVVKVPASRLPEGFGFMLAHPSATVAPTKLEDYKLHQDPPGINGTLVEGRIVYDAFVMENKAKAIYYLSVGNAE